MASLTRYPKGYKVRYRVYYPDGANRVAYAYRSTQREAMRLKGQAESLESITSQNALTPETAIPFVHHRLLTEADVQRWWPRRRGPLQYDTEALRAAYRSACQRVCTGQDTITESMRRAGTLTAELGNLAHLTEEDILTWQQDRLAHVARKTVILAHDVLRQLLDCCQRLGWRDDNPARAVKRLTWKVSRLPQALAFLQVQQALERSQELGEGAPSGGLMGQLYRLMVAGIFFGLRRGELQHLL